MICALVVVGTIGDLAGRSLRPAVARLIAARRLDQLTADLTRQAVALHSVLLLEIHGGDPTRPIRDDEAEECRRVIDAVFAVWADNTAPPREHPAGSSVSEPPARARRRREGLDL
jgi:glucose-6-phosphate 1-dehydrogenase